MIAILPYIYNYLNRPVTHISICDMAREMSHMLKIFNFEILIPLSGNVKCYILMQLPLETNIWLQSCMKFINSQTV